MTRSRIMTKSMARVGDELLDEFTVKTAAAVVGIVVEEQLGVVDELDERVILCVSIFTEESLATVNDRLETNLNSLLAFKCLKVILT